MSNVIDKTISKTEIIESLYQVGVREGMVLEVHSSLFSLGYVIGGAQTVVDALLEILGEDGTLVMPLNMNENSEVSRWENPLIEYDQIKKVRDNIPSFDKNSSDTYDGGSIVENFRRRENVVISSHPSKSFVAKGKHAYHLCNHQSLHFPLSSESPMARLYELRAYCLLIGVGVEKCTSIHLAEYACDCRPIIVNGAAVNRNGVRVWKKYLDLKLENQDFKFPFQALDKLSRIEKGNIGLCPIALFSVNDAVDEATRYFEGFNSYSYYR
ncbi:MAG: AAC(3) family N-acetyltransferase [Erysipelotrichaceae bacterium]|nr:AAC(3) family N-acetyltransferase [Erysipelotrichaceae bacterium]